MAIPRFWFPNMGARELNDFTSWNTISRGVSGAASSTRKFIKNYGEVGAIHASNAEGRDSLKYGHFTSAIGGMRGQIGGQEGQKFDASINSFLQKLQAAGGHKIGGADLSKAIGDLHKEIEEIASTLGGSQGNILKDFTTTLRNLETKSLRGGVGALGGGTRDSIKAAFGLKADNSIESARKQMAEEIKNAGKELSSVGLKLSLDRVVREMERLSASAKDAAEKQRILANAQKRIHSLASGTIGGPDREILEGLAQSSGKNVGELQKSLLGQASNRKGLEFSNRVAQLTHAIGGATRYLIPLKRTLDVGNTIFQNVNSKFNQFARMQMRVSAERGAFGRQVRGAGINYGHMMTAIGAGRSAGMEDRQVIGQMVGLQTQLAQARWGEGGLAENVGRWGISVYNGAGGVKEAHDLMIDFSRKLKSLGTNMEKLQFLHAIGRRPEEMEYVANYEKQAKRMEWLKQNPHMQGILEKADILDETGFSAKADAATKIELRRREILNQNAIEQGPFEALKRSLNPENWLLNDWTARQKGVQQARGELAMERLTRVMQEIAAQGRKKGGGSSVSAARMLSAEDLAALSTIAQKEIDNKGGKAGFAGVLDAYKNSFGMEFDVRTPIEKLQASLVPLTNKIAELCERIYQSLAKGAMGKAVNYAAENPLKSIAIVLGSVMLLRKSPSIIGGLLKRGVGIGGAKGASEGLGSIGKEAAKATEKAAGKSVAKAAMTAAEKEANIAAGIIPDAKGVYHIPSDGLGKGAASAATASEAVAKGAESAASGSGRVWWKPSTWFKGGGGAAVESAASTTSSVSGSIGKGAAKSTETAVEKGVSKSLGKTLAKGAGSVATLAFFAYDSKEAYDAYSRGDTAEGNRTMGSAVGGLAGAALGLKAGLALGGKIGALAGTAAAPGVGTALGGFIGATILGTGGAILGAYGMDKLNEGLEVQGSDAQRKKTAGFQKGDFVVDPRRASEDFINSLRAALKNNDLTRAINMLDSKGIQVDIEALKDEKFQKDDSYANQVLQGSALASTIASYVAKTGHAISADEYNAALEKDKYYQSARAAGIQMTSNDLNNAVMRQTGYSGKAKATTFEMAKRYLKYGWNTPEAMREEMARVAEKNPGLSYSERKAKAEENLKKKHAQNLTQADYQNVANSMWNRNQDILEYNDLADEAKRYGMDGYGIRRNSEGQMMDAEGYLVDSNGNRIDKGGRHEGDEGYEAARVGAALSEDGIYAYEALMEFRRAHPEAKQSWLLKRTKSMANKYLDKSEEERQGLALGVMEKQGIDTSKRTFSQMFNEEKQKKFRDFMNSHENMDASQALAEFSMQNGMSLEEGREFLYNNKDAISGTGDKYLGLWAELQKSKSFKAEQKRENARKKKEEETKGYKEAIQNASLEEITAALGGEEGQAKALKSQIYEDWGDLPEEAKKERERLINRVGRKLSKKDKNGGNGKYKPLNEPYKPTAEEQADIDAADKESARLVKEQQRAKKMRPLAEYSDIRYMGDLIQRGGIADDDKELAKHFGEDRVRQFRKAQQDGTLEHLMNGDHYKDVKAKKKRNKPQMSREQAEAAYRQMAEANFKQKEGESDEDYKKRIDEQVASNMELYDTLHPQKKGKAGGKGSGAAEAASAASAGATGAMESSKSKAEQASQKMADTGAAANAAAASAKEAQGAVGGSVVKNTTINMGGQTITQNISGEHSMDAEGMKRGTMQGASEITNMMAASVAGVSQHTRDC